MGGDHWHRPKIDKFRRMAQISQWPTFKLWGITYIFSREKWAVQTFISGSEMAEWEFCKKVCWNNSQLLGLMFIYFFEGRAIFSPTFTIPPIIMVQWKIAHLETFATHLPLDPNISTEPWGHGRKSIYIESTYVFFRPSYLRLKWKAMRKGDAAIREVFFFLGWENPLRWMSRTRTGS